MFILILFAFIAGFVTILSPCILPVLPIVLSGSLTGGKKRPLGIVTGFILSFTFFTLLLSSLVKSTGISADSLRLVSVFAIGFFGVSLIIPQTQVLLELLFSKLSGFIPKSNSESGYGEGVILGACLGLIWTPCVGPILASVITLALSGSTNFSAFFITLAYSLGTGIPMLAITYGGRQLLQRVPWLLSNTAKIQKGFGIVMIAMAVLIFFNADRKIQTIILTAFPQYGAGLTSIEDNNLVQKELDKLRGGMKVDESVKLTTAGVLPDKGKAPNPTFDGATKWLGSEPLSLDGNLKGKVVLVDFWTYSCINCIRTLPYLRDWYSKYKDMGFVIVGVHSPEFAFEKEEKNVLMAMKDFQIEYPVVQDNDFRIWNSYANHYWPAHYLIDSKGHLRDVHFGEGNYKETEENIQALLKEAGQTVSNMPTSILPGPQTGLFPAQISPETYLGWGRGQSYTQTQTPSISGGTDISSQFIFRDPLADGEVGLRGKWSVDEEKITSQSNSSTLTMNIKAGKVFLVLGGRNPQHIPVTVKLDGKDVDSSVVTADYNMSGGISVEQDRKYDIVDFKGKIERHDLELTIPTGIHAYAFTFGE